jgi:uncharacterized phage-associated protein
MRSFNYKKAVQSLNFLSHKEGGKTNKMKAIKLVWLADRLHLRRHGRTITGDIYFALKHGPVPSTTRDILEENPFGLDEDEFNYASEFIKVTDKYNFTSQSELDDKVFSATDIKALEDIFKTYGKYDHFELRDISHQFPEWKKYESALNSRVSSRFPMLFEDFFEDADPRFDKLQIDPEIKSVSKEIFQENGEFINFFKH